MDERRVKNHAEISEMREQVSLLTSTMQMMFPEAMMGLKRSKKAAICASRKKLGADQRMQK